MKALILRGKVVQVSEAHFPVHPEFAWVDLPSGSPVQPGWIYTGSDFVPPPVAVPGAGGAGGSAVGGDVNIGGRGGDGAIGGAGGDAISDRLNIGGRGGDSTIGSMSSSSPSRTEHTPWWKNTWSVALGIATIVAAVVAVIQLFAR